MIFLKKFKATGFKSFANNIDLDFSQPMSGIVGPNGSGKSNIVDAVKWVLGERSAKTLRGKSNEDVIFHGSNDHQAAKFAEVTLTFDNSKKVIHYDGKEISITRKLTKGTGSNEYFINDAPARLKDIQDIFLDTGLSKGSLGIISQGTVQWFVEAKPEDRRTIFEDAAGIGLYTKKKEESNAELARVSENLNRLTDLTNELGKDVNKLSKQAEKAKIYDQKKKELMHLDLTILVKDLSFFQEKLSKIQIELKKAKSELEVFEPNIKSITESLKVTKERAEAADKEVESLTTELADLVEEVNKIENAKNTIKNKLTNDIQTDNVEKRAEAYRQLLSTTKFELDDTKQKATKLQDEINVYTDTIEQLATKRNELMDISSKQSIRSAEIRVEIKNINDALENKSHLDTGVKTIIENKEALTGINGLVKDFLQVEDQYEKAILTALGKNINNIIVDTTDDAKIAVDFLKKNKAGKATFLPLDIIKPRGLKEEYYQVINGKNGFINTANKLITFDEKYQNIFNFLLGNIIISDDINNATILSQYTYQLYRVITLDGDIVAPGGVISGGFNKVNSLNSVNLKKKLTELEDEFEHIDNELINCRVELDKTNAEWNETNTKQNERKIIMSRYEESIRNNESQLYKYQMDYDQLVKKNNLEDKRNKWSETSLNEQLAKLQSKKDHISINLNTSRQTKMINKASVEDYEAKLTELRFLVDKHRDTIATHETEKVRCEAVIDNTKTKINQTYKMTLDYAKEHYNDELPMSDAQARETISRLQADIDKLGSINMTAIEELEEKQKRFEEMTIQQKEIEKAHNDLIQVIKEMDVKAKEDFTKTIDAVNKELPTVFKYLFGGGTSEIQFVNPDDVLMSGIDVLANPPGKKVTNLNLLSGGEKTLVALSILFTILKIKSFPLIILDEAESALDPANVERFGNIIKENSKNTQFLVITHRPGTMERCDYLYGATMGATSQTKGITTIFPVSLTQAKKDFANDKDK